MRIICYFKGVVVQAGHESVNEADLDVIKFQIASGDNVGIIEGDPLMPPLSRDIKVMKFQDLYISLIRVRALDIPYHAGPLPFQRHCLKRFRQRSPVTEVARV